MYLLLTKIERNYATLQKKANFIRVIINKLKKYIYLKLIGFINFKCVFMHLIYNCVCVYV